MLNTFEKRLSVTLATWFGIGRIPGAPGTFGSLAACLCALPIAAAAGTPGLAFAAAAVSLLGIPAAAAAEKALGRKDPGCIVIDEVAGQWIALLPAAPDLASYALAFAAFRLFDIWKPGPIGWADKNLSGGLGIMTDDIIAGGFAAAVVALAGPFLPPVIRFF
ncbi:phosphatidylglycerophosphatase A [Oleispirillum naphthae]|uniref:phosphatidylglycerophosphatase A family protein n=1 Tax=Oleispirillum naphthae TaxID=2838853 RepID=UPI00308246CD